ncbi:hypothetical protein UFOVP130_60 [uncultured Caudovirales phage]|uniref:Uncharacterized protein n=1 Tax=uncultured Caudovirales phage TaxID=2100421 RepID=A0A6J5LD56_9CAUD|nr:hypothetical protein UFOVP130_60 [uncultured Caudovirales phage]
MKLIEKTDTLLTKPGIDRHRLVVKRYTHRMQKLVVVRTSGTQHDIEIEADTVEADASGKLIVKKGEKIVGEFHSGTVVGWWKKTT